MDPIPVVSQLKSFVQFVFGKREQARETQINFSRQCPVVSQIRSAVEAIQGDQEAARETQREFGHFLVGVVNSVPVVGHISGVVHYACKDKDGGDQAMKAASHTTAVIGGAIGGAFVAGPFGAVGLGIAAGAAMDGSITAIDTAVHWKETKEIRPFGITEPLRDPTDPGKWFDAVGGVVMDGAMAYGTGKLVETVRVKSGARGRAATTAKNMEKVSAVRLNVPNMTLFVQVSEGFLNIVKKKLMSRGKDIILGRIKVEVIKTLRPIGGKFLIWLKNKTVHIKDASGNDRELREDKVYKVSSTGEVEEDHDKKMPNNRELQKDKVYTMSSSGEFEEIEGQTMQDYIECVFLDRHRYIEDTEEESSGESYSEDTDEETSNDSSTEDTDEESSYATCTDDTDEESGDESSTKDTDESSYYSSTEETGEESSDESSTEITDEESSDESSSENTDEESSDESSTRDTDESSYYSSTEETGEESSYEGSALDTEEESSKESSTEDSEKENGYKSSNKVTGEKSRRLKRRVALGKEKLSEKQDSDDSEGESRYTSSTKVTGEKIRRLRRRIVPGKEKRCEEQESLEVMVVKPVISHTKKRYC